MTLGWILLAILAVLLVASLPFWPHSRDWGLPAPLSFGILLLIAVLMKLSGTLDPLLRSVVGQ